MRKVQLLSLLAMSAAMGGLRNPDPVPEPSPFPPDPPDPPTPASSPRSQTDAVCLSKAEEKRRRKAVKRLKP